MAPTTHTWAQTTFQVTQAQTLPPVISPALTCQRCTLVLDYEQTCTEEELFKLYSLSVRTNRKPAQWPEHWTNMVLLPGSSQDSSNSVLDL